MPSMLMLGRDTIQPIDLILALLRHTSQDPSACVSYSTHNLAEVQNLAKKKIGGTQLRQKK